MKKSRFTEEQIVFALKQAELGTSVPDVCRKLGISDATFYTWRKKYGGISPSELKHMRQLEEENLRLKRLVADLSLDKAMLQDVLAKELTLARLREWVRFAGPLRGQRRQGLFCAAGQPQLVSISFCGRRRQRAAATHP
jgi:putative transposase